MPLQNIFSRVIFIFPLFAVVSVFAGCKPKEGASAESALPVNMYVFAEPSLPLNEQPSATAKELVALPFGASVTVGKPAGNPETRSGKTGQWVQATYQGKSGWIFSGFLSPVPLPQANCSGLADYARTAFTPEGPETRAGDDPAQAAKGAGSYTWQQKFSGNVSAEGSVTEGIRTMTLFIPARDDEIGFQICKRCASHFRSLTYASFKAQSGTIKDCGWRTKQGGCVHLWSMEVTPVEGGLSIKCALDHM